MRFFKLCGTGLAVWLWLAFSPALRAGGSGLNVAIVVNQNSSNSVQLGNYYRELRQVPPENVFRVSWTGDNMLWSLTDFTNTLVNPLRAMLANRGLTNQIDYVVLSMDFPYRVSAANSEENSTTSALAYGFKADPNPPCSVASGSATAYAGSEGLLRAMWPFNAASNTFLVTMLTANTLEQARQIAARAVSSDATFPTQTVLLGKSGDPARNIRFFEFDNTIFDTRLRGNYAVARANLYEPGALTNLLGYMNGSYSANVAAGAFVPGAMVDNLTSFGGQLFQYTSGQTTLLAFLTNGAAGSYGTVTEPCNYPEKFPNSEIYFYQSRGFNVAECYYMGVTNPYQGLVAGEPLAAPFAKPATGDWNGLTDNSILSGTANLGLRFNAAEAQRPLQQVDLFVDGVWYQTLTNIPPRPGTVFSMSINGNPASYTVPANATLASVANGVAGALNAVSYATATQVQAIQHGDRIELRSIDPTKTGAQVSLSISNNPGSGPANTFLSASRANFLDSTTAGVRGCYVMGTASAGSYLQLVVTRTNGATVTLSVTNTAGDGTRDQLTQQLMNLVNGAPELQGSDGLTAEDFQSDSIAQFNLRARGAGYAAAQIQAILNGGNGVVAMPSSAVTLTGNLMDLQPRNHLYVTTGVTNQTFNFAFDTTLFADGYHELAAVAYEGSHVRTQTRAVKTVRIRNTGLSATLNVLFGDNPTAREATLQFSVTASTNNIAKIELFSTGGSVGVASNQATAVFSVPGASLDVGQHSFYAVVTAANGERYWTESHLIRIVDKYDPVTLQITAPPPALTLTWTAAVGRSYDVLSSPNVMGPYELRATVVAANSTGQWVENSPSPTQLFYRIRVTP